MGQSTTHTITALKNNGYGKLFTLFRYISFDLSGQFPVFRRPTGKQKRVIFHNANCMAGYLLSARNRRSQYCGYFRSQSGIRSLFSMGFGSMHHRINRNIAYLCTSIEDFRTSSAKRTMNLTVWHGICTY